MKVTLNIDEELLDRVVEHTGASTKTEAISIALKEVDRRKRLVDVLREGLGATVDELKNMFVADYDGGDVVIAEAPGPEVAATTRKPVTYGKALKNGKAKTNG
jgi:hypothetical protein